MALKTGQLASKIVLRDPRNIEPFVLRKQAPGSRNAQGEYIPGASTDQSLEGSIQPLDGRSREDLPEAERLKDAICLLYETENHDEIRPLRIGADQTDSDLIIWQNQSWAVRVVYDMATFGHLEIYATKID